MENCENGPKKAAVLCTTAATAEPEMNQAQEKPASYASKQVNRISGGDNKKVKVVTDLGETKWLNISDEQLEAINKILND